MRWKIRAYAVGPGKTVIDEWQADAPEAAIVKFDSRLDFMKDQAIWPHHYAHLLKGTDGIWEVKFESGNIAYRPLFFMGPGKGEITILAVGVEHNNKLKPSGIVGTALSRKGEVVASPQKALEYDG